MLRKFQKAQLTVTLKEFLDMVTRVKSFTSSKGRRYQVQRIENQEMFFLRLDAKVEKEWVLNLERVYTAYSELQDFSTVSFKPYVPIMHSPARGLLLHLGMLLEF